MHARGADDALLTKRAHPAACLELHVRRTRASRRALLPPAGPSAASPGTVTHTHTRAHTHTHTHTHTHLHRCHIAANSAAASTARPAAIVAARTFCIATIEIGIRQPRRHSFSDESRRSGAWLACVWPLAKGGAGPGSTQLVQLPRGARRNVPPQLVGISR